MINRYVCVRACVRVRARARARACVCVCVRERERERGGGRERFESNVVFFPRRFLSGNLFLTASFPNRCLLVPFCVSILICRFFSISFCLKPTESCSVQLHKVTQSPKQSYVCGRLYVHVNISYMVLPRCDCHDISTCTSFCKQQLEKLNCFAHVSRIDLRVYPPLTNISSRVSSSFTLYTRIQNRCSDTRYQKSGSTYMCGQDDAWNSLNSKTQATSHT